MQHENPSKKQSAAPGTRLAAIQPPAAGNHLTAKQEKFALAVAQGMSQADAYRSAYSTGKMKAETIQAEASRLMVNRMITARVDALRVKAVAAMTEQYAYDYSDAMKEATMVLEFAKQNGQSATMGQMVALKAKLSGLMVEERKNDLCPIASMSPERVKAALEAIQAFKKDRSSGSK